MALSTSWALTYEEWAEDEFGDADLPIAQMLEDPDEDTLTNLREYAMGTDPQKYDPCPMDGAVQEHDGEDYLTVTFPIQPDAEDLVYFVRGADSVGDLESGQLLFRREANGAFSSRQGLLSEDGDEFTVGDIDHPLSSDAKQRFLMVFIQAAEFMEFVTVGSPGNTPVTNTGIGQPPVVGRVDRAFQMGKFEVTNDQYVAFLNAIGGNDEDRVVYVPQMMASLTGGIERHGSNPPFTYSVKEDMGNKPVNWVSFWAALRFCNWLHNGRPMPADRDMSPETTEDGAYDLTDSGAITLNTVRRSPDAKYFLPNEDEWFKAAYYQSSIAKYRRYATGSNTVPTAATADMDGNVDNPGLNVATFDDTDDEPRLALGTAVWDLDNDGQLDDTERQGMATTVGSGGSLSAYGAANMTANMQEWIESVAGTEQRVMRGASWKLRDFQLSNSYRFIGFPVLIRRDLGFRVARAVPDIDFELIGASTLNLEWDPVPDQKVRIEASPDLLNPDWKPLGDGLLNDQIKTLLDPEIGNVVRRFYRLVVIK